MQSIKRQFGSYRGYITHLQARLAGALGFYRSAESVEWSKVRRLVFVCKGNVCRSPFAEAHAKQLGLDAVSFGLHTDGNTPANEQARIMAGVKKIDLAQHRSRKFSIGELAHGDLLLVFEPAHYHRLVASGLPSETQVTLLGLWTKTDATALIPDPYGKSDAYFDACFSRIAAALENLASRVPRKV